MTTSSLKVFIAFVAAAIFMVAATYLVYGNKTMTVENNHSASNAYFQPTETLDSPINNSSDTTKDIFNDSVINKNSLDRRTTLKTEGLSHEHLDSQTEETQASRLSKDADEYTYEREHTLAKVLSKIAIDEGSTISQEDIAILESLNTQDIDYEYIKTHIDDSLF